MLKTRLTGARLFTVRCEILCNSMRVIIGLTVIPGFGSSIEAVFLAGLTLPQVDGSIDTGLVL